MNNEADRQNDTRLMVILIGGMLFALLLSIIIFIQIIYRPLPSFYAISADNQHLKLIARTEPNYVPTTLIKWASEAAASAYTFNFSDYQKQLEAVKPFFTEAGWSSYRNSISSLLNTVISNQLFINSVVSGPPVIVNEGPLPGYDYVWRIQVPLLASYTTAETSEKQNFIVTLTIVKIPTSENPKGIGIDQFVMNKR